MIIIIISFKKLSVNGRKGNTPISSLPYIAEFEYLLCPVFPKLKGIESNKVNAR